MYLSIGVQIKFHPCSFQGHYSMKKSAAFLGIGTDNVYHVKVDERYVPLYKAFDCLFCIHHVACGPLHPSLTSIYSQWQNDPRRP